LYGPLICVFFYVLFCRYGCTVSISEQNIEIRYFAPWQKNVSVNVADIVRVDYEKGYYDWFASKRIVEYRMSGQYCYDHLIIYQKDPENPILYFNVNTRAFDFDKILMWAVEKKILDKVAGWWDR